MLVVVGVSAVVPAAADNVLFVNVNVLPMDREGVLRDRYVLIEDGTVTAISGTDDMRLPPGTQLIDAAGQYLMPGLTDMHVHPRNRADLDSFLAYGVTSVRVASGEERYMGWRDGVRNGTLRGPRLHVSSPYVWDNGPDIWGNDPESPEHMRQMIRGYDEAGYDSIKIVDSYDDAETSAMMDEAGARGIRVFGHVADDSENFDYEWQAGLGYWSIEHLDEVVRLAIGNEADQAAIEGFVDLAKEQGLAFTSLFGGLYRRNARVERILAGGSVYPSEQKERGEFVSGRDGLQRMKEAEERYAGMSEEEIRDLYWPPETTFAVLRGLVAAGVPVYAGSEGAGTSLRAGETLLLELDIFIDAGVSRYNSLKAATLDAANGLTLEGVSGRVADDAAGDFILLGANPLDDLAALRELRGVLAAGRWLGPEELAKLRAAL